MLVFLIGCCLLYLYTRMFARCTETRSLPQHYTQLREPESHSIKSFQTFPSQEGPFHSCSPSTCRQPPPKPGREELGLKQALTSSNSSPDSLHTGSKSGVCSPPTASSGPTQTNKRDRNNFLYVQSLQSLTSLIIQFLVLILF